MGCGDRDTEGYRDGDTEMTPIWGGDMGMGTCTGVRDKRIGTGMWIKMGTGQG